ncbi:Peptidoglycan/xylan/chitin deacetylase, PgdA/CDA1 family [Streptoalloteichus tenebrarius]|uniref:Peptidoglycan/xylan/chitin deacetylase, PgdA/CDA1 family n=1 Tax=Streptoalloteichus tenebrarius (strain ATCC 17920 / DSM 40477 / JCM 4838 / CBS 697.72 / NBRC 16177 / NCIMB 11028 / NRRL B-12390 / A12253. 1 / ISP 5477) TaxID=1933 RepID=A0ABT1HUZ1_STRSD|nr:polysaccharide deacetylase family protein [Streptoalloteichus tenebrarius]MCP2259332.1 Peptidoglycan/xylan/chitin deacetylase, PgdA/CDA1 family [Streptoalloteichus tenebrarius]BFE99097.1 polysaccharide deacetylase family protein [Streptoalloteichus tenebrarius]
MIGLLRSRRARVWTISVAVALVVVLVSAFALLRVARSRTFQFFGELVDRVDTTEKVVALTFDDGPDPAGTREILDTLAARRVPATFFLIGRDLAAHPDLGRAIATAGHEIGNHSYSHERMIGVTPGWVAREIESTDTLIRATGYTGRILFRPPNGKKLLALPHYLAEHQRTTVMWDVEPDSDPGEDPSAEEIAAHTVEHVRPGSIVLLHAMYAGRKRTREALGPMIDQLRERGYRFTTVSELLGSGGRRASDGS